ncbi:MAG: DUF6291 domain-containing protein [Lachnospiraceae bacterium]|nr:DUF6291 domain-containing protein [Lachnospiraceae bacterium]
MAKLGRAAYFRFFLECCDLISLLDDASAGRVIKAVSNYFRDQTEPEGMKRNESIVFSRIRRDIDASFEDYKRAVEAGRKGWNEVQQKRRKEPSL